MRANSRRRRPTADIADVAAAMAVRGHLELTGPGDGGRNWPIRCGLAPSRVLVGLARLEAEGFAMRGRFDPALGTDGTVVRPSPPGPPPQLQPEPAAARNRARQLLRTS